MSRRAMLLLVAMVGTLIVGSGIALAATLTCGLNPCLGTDDPDTITGTNTYNSIIAFAGNDIVYALEDNDIVSGNEGNDIVEGGLGQDDISGGPDGDGSAEGTSFGQRNLEGEQDSDVVYGGGGADYIDAAHNDTLSSIDYSYGQGGNDRIYAVDGNEDIIDCGKGKRDVAYIDKGIDTTTGCEKKIAEA